MEDGDDYDRMDDLDQRLGATKVSGAPPVPRRRRPQAGEEYESQPYIIQKDQLVLGKELGAGEFGAGQFLERLRASTRTEILLT